MAALDERERYYQRVRVPIEAFDSHQSLGEAWTYSASHDAPAVFEATAGFRPHWRDVVMAREGAYGRREAFGIMFDETTYMADGKTLVVEAYRDQLPSIDPGTNPGAPDPAPNPVSDPRGS